MAGTATSRGVRLAGHYLNELLLTEYRRQWYYRGDRNRSNKVNTMAVAYVLAVHRLGDTAVEVEYQEDAKRIKDTVYRALVGRILTRETLELFMDAFAMSEAHCETLARLWDGTAAPRVLIGDMPPIARPNPAARTKRRYETVQRHEFHYLGADGQPVRHRTIQTIRALVDGYSVHPYTFDLSEVELEFVLGGAPSEPYQLQGTHWAVDVQLPETLSIGQAVPMEFSTIFRNDAPLEPCFRYATHQRLTDLMFRVEFHPRCLPRSVHWTEWRDYREPDDVVTHSQSAALNREHSVVQHLEVLENAVAGFAWEF
ncbi:hypothetical protein KDL01_04890 [Actinospica durhamensis]|uniref:Uncharacterized protein n=1 Tax=Actinospica durhamensis TaxID=1508375 RepID=A0A941EL78_9ACTN|nr:hypothetical protein [Actinospica durhamensis]MBR7832582.1 hypothetical protein [Actinospica durhamensis]